MVGIIFATKTEALPFLNFTEANIVENASFLLFKPSKFNKKLLPCSIMISGIGKLAAALATAELILRHGSNFIINAGICGALNSDFPSALGSIYRISSATEANSSFGLKNHIKSFKSSSFFAGLTQASLITCDKAIFDENLKRKYSVIADLVDMEGAAVIQVANMYNVKCDIIKGVSDLANSEGMKMVKYNIKQVSTNIAEIILHAIKNKNQVY